MMKKPKLLFGVAALVLLYFGWGVIFPIRVANSPPRDGPIVAFGDSLTEGIGASRGHTYPDQLAKLIGRPVVNKGVAGETAEEALRRLDDDVISQNPGVVIVLLGGNDLLRRVDPEKTFAALDSIVSRSVDSGAMVVLVGIEGLPVLSARFGPRFKKLARKAGCVYVPDILDGIEGNRALLSDQVHPNDKGYEIIAGKIADAMKPRLN